MSIKRTSFTLIVLIIVVCLIVFYFFFHSKFEKRSLNIQPNLSTQPAQQPEAIDKKANFLKSSKITFPQTSSSTTIPSLPVDLTFLQIPDGFNVKILEIIYEDSKKGFDLTMDLDYPLLSAHMAYSKLLHVDHKDWNVLRDAYIDTAGIFDIENNYYQARIFIYAVGKQLVKINIQLIHK